MQDPTQSESLYTLVSFDPDAPSREDQQFGPWRHFVLPGLKPKSLDALPTAAAEDREAVKGLSVNGLVEQTAEALSPWVPASPGAGTGSVRAGGEAASHLVCPLRAVYAGGLITFSPSP